MIKAVVSDSNAHVEFMCVNYNNEVVTIRLVMTNNEMFQIEYWDDEFDSYARSNTNELYNKCRAQFIPVYCEYNGASVTLQHIFNTIPCLR